MLRKLILLTAMALLSAAGAMAELTASLITCYPGPEVYELCGHEALRIRGVDKDGTLVDSVWNYGVFDFNTPNFVYRFVKGETDYMVIGYPFIYFLPEYQQRGSTVVEQDLNLLPEETEHLRRLLQINSLRQNRTYRYNYVRDNCATRILAMVDSATARDVNYPGETRFRTFREAMRHYHRGYPWYQLGIDLSLGSGIDMPISAREETFVPMELERHASLARFDDGRALVKERRVLYQGTDARLSPTPFLLSPLFFSLLILLLSVVIGLYDWRQKRLTRWWYSLYFGMLGAAGCVIWFLVFVSTHYATSPNILSFWLNPLQLIIAALLWVRRARPAVTAMIWINILLCVLPAIIWPFQPQSANAAIWPMMAADLVLCAAYILSGAQYTPEKTPGVRRQSRGKDKGRRSAKSPARKRQK